MSKLSHNLSFVEALVLKYILVCTCICGVIATDGYRNRTLVFTQILCRHGVRAPIQPYPGDPFGNESFWPNGWGGLTELGELGQYEVGEFLRTRYNNLLSNRFSTKEIFVLSSDYDRNIVSAQALLSGLYKSEPTTNFERRTRNWKLFPVHTMPAEYDNLIQPKVHNSQIKNVYNCARYNQLVKDAFNSTEVYQHTQDNLELFHFLQNHTGNTNWTRLVEAGLVIDALRIENLYNLEIPSWAKEIVQSPEAMKIMAFGFQVLGLTDEMKRLAGGPLLSKFVENMKNKVSGLEQRKMHIYLGHDLILGNIMDTLGVHEQHWIDFSAALILDLYCDNSTGVPEYTVEIFYRKTPTDLISMKLPRCKEPCTLNNFIESVKQFIPINLDKECQVGVTEGVIASCNSTTSGSAQSASLIAACAVLAILLIGLLGYHILRRNKVLAYEVYS